MRMDDQQESENVEDLRGAGGFRPVHGIGIGTLVVLLIGGWLLGINPIRMLGLLSGAGDDTQTAGTQAEAPPADDPQARFVAQILRSTEVVWGHAFEQTGRQYQQPRLVLYRGSIGTACGLGQAAAGPFYCPNDRKVYLDLGFFDLMTQRLGAPGQFAHAYVVAHEVGHHVQNLLGTVGRGDADRGANGQSVRLELQADCYAGAWASLSQHEHGWRLEPGDIETALNAAAQIGDDTLQRRSTGVVVPDSFTHGTSAQRVAWFKRGFESASLESCDTFAAPAL